VIARASGWVAFAPPAVLLLTAENSFAGLLAGVCVVSAIWLLGVAAAGRAALGSVLAGSTLAAIFAASAVKQKLLALPLLATDVHFLRHAAANLTILRRYPSVAVPLVAAAVLFAVLAVLAWRSPRISLSRRALAVAAAAALLIAPMRWSAATPASAADPFAEPIAAWRFISGGGALLSRLAFSVHRMGVAIPPPVYANADVAADFAAPPPEASPQMPDILLWHDESTLDPALIEACNRPECRSSLFAPGQHTASSGLLATHIFGGFSCTSEFAVLTGLDHRTFGPGGIYSHITLAHRIAFPLPRALKRLGYRTVALYPNDRNFLNAAEGYRHYGFDEFLAAQDLGLPADPWLVTDAMMRQQLLRVLPLESRPARPTFVYVLTQYQHEPHDQPLSDLPEPYRSLRFESLKPAASTSLVNYLYRLRQTEDAVAAVKREYLTSTRPTMLIHYGDHQPTLDGAMAQLGKRGLDAVPPALRHLITNFEIAANFPPLARESHPWLDIAFLPSLILDTAGLPGGDFFTASSRLRRLCSGRYLDCSDTARLGRFHDYVFHRLGAVR
jgi:phosphoglycerol transferase MdoB-like AlkP superfamily enzyme